MAEITHKKGDTLEWVITLTENAVAVDITNFTIQAQIRQKTTLIATLTTTITNASGGVFSLFANQFGDFRMQSVELAKVDLVIGKVASPVHHIAD